MQPGRADAVIFMDTAPGSPPGIDPDVVAFGVAIVQAEGMAALRVAQDEIDPLGSPVYQRVLRDRPGFREYAARKWAALSPVMWAVLAVEITSQADELAELAAAGRTSADAGDRRRAGHAVPRGSSAIAAAVPGV